MFFLELSCINKTINVTDESCNIILKMIRIKLEAQPGIEELVKNFKYKTEITDKKQITTPNNEIFKIRTHRKSKYTEIELNPWRTKLVKFIFDCPA
jgi:hypothetical protein